MSVGVGVGDFIAVGELCWKVYTQVKDSPGKYAELASEVKSLYTVIKETGNILSHQAPTGHQQAELVPCQQGCERVLKDLDKLLRRYKSLGTKSYRTVDRVGFGMQDVNAVRLRLISNVTMLDAFNNASSNARLERKMNRLIKEVGAGQREESIVSVETFSTKVDEDQEAWDALRRELEDVGVSSDVVIKRRPFIIKWFQTALAAEQCHEVEPDDPVAETADPSPQRKSKSQQEGERRPHPIDRRLLKAMSQRNTARLMDYLKKKGAHDLGYDDEGLTALHIAVKHGNNNVLRMLLKYGADVNAKTVDGQANALSFALESSDVKLTEILLKHGANAVAESDYMATPLMKAAQDCGTAHIKLLLDYGAQIDKRDNRGNIALMHAAVFNKTEVVVFLIEMGADVESKSVDGNTALTLAAQLGRVDLIQALLEKGANTESKGSRGMTPLMWAAVWGNVDAVKTLLRLGAKTRNINDSGSNALNCAMRFNHEGINEEVIRLLKAAEPCGENLDMVNPT